MNKKHYARHKLNEYDKLKKQNSMTQHHILNRCRRDLYNVFQEGNTTPMIEKEHQIRHLCHKNETPKETLRNISRMTQVMSTYAKQLYYELCRMSDEEFYDHKFLTKKKR